jgi:hypothetical protein
MTKGLAILPAVSFVLADWLKVALGISMVILGVVLVALTMALGG